MIRKRNFKILDIKRTSPSTFGVNLILITIKLYHHDNKNQRSKCAFNNGVYSF